MAKGSRTDAERRAEGAVEARHVAESAGESHVDHPCRLPAEQQGRATEPRTTEVPMRREASDPLERAKEVIRAEAGLSSHGGEWEAAVSVPFDLADDSRDACQSARVGPVGCPRASRGNAQRLTSESHGQILPGRVFPIGEGGAGFGDETRKGTQRWQAKLAEVEPRPARAGAGRHDLEV